MNIKRFFNTCLSGFTLFLLASQTSQLLAATYYVAPIGKDTNNGAQATPFATIQKAANVVNPGDKVIVKDGVYTDTNGDNFIVSLNRGGNAQNWVTFTAENKGKAVLDGQSNKTGYGWNFGANANYVRVENFEIKGCGLGGIWSNAGAHHVYVKGNNIHDIGRRYTSSAYGQAGIFQGKNTSYHTYDSNIIKNIGRIPEAGKTISYAHDHGIYAVGSYTDIINNIFVNCTAGWGVQIVGARSTYGEIAGDYYKIINNTFVGPNPQRNGQIIICNESHDILIQNNIFYQPKGAGVITYGGSGGKQYNVTMRNNLTDAGMIGTITDMPTTPLAIPSNYNFVFAGNLTGTNPSFVNAAGGDYHLNAGSPAIDKGYASGSPTYDMAGSARPFGAAIDLGAYEYGANAGTNPTTAIAGIFLTNVTGPKTGLTSIGKGQWYNLNLNFSGWDNISYVDVWISHSSSTEGTVANRGGRFFAASNYMTSLSISNGQLWVRETEGSTAAVNMIGKLGKWLDATGNQYVQDNVAQQVKVKFKLLETATTGDWVVNAFIHTKSGQDLPLTKQAFTVTGPLADNSPPSKPRNVNVTFSSSEN